MIKRIFALAAMLSLGVSGLAYGATENVAKLVFTTPPQNIATGASSAKLTFQTRTATDVIETVTGLTVFALDSSSDTGEFAEANLSTNECAETLSWGITQIGMAGGTHSRSFCYRDSTSGDYLLTVSPVGPEWTAATQTIEVVGGVDVTPPAITNVRVENIGSTTARVLWDRNENTTSRLLFATSTPVQSSNPEVIENILGTEADLIDLAASTTYHFVIEASDAAGNQATTTASSFVTLGGDGDDGDDGDDNGNDDDEEVTPPEEERSSSGSSGSRRRAVTGEVLGAFTDSSTLSEEDRRLLASVLTELARALQDWLQNMIATEARATTAPLPTFPTTPSSPVIPEMKG